MKWELSGRPVAPQIRSFRTNEEFNTFVRDTEAGARHIANDYMARGKSAWIGRAEREGWTSVLRSLVYQLARKDRLEYGDFPSNARLDLITINRDDHERFKILGRSLTP